MIKEYPPEKIYLQWYDENGEPAHPEDRTWCVDKINNNDIEYKKASVCTCDRCLGIEKVDE